MAALAAQKFADAGANPKAAGPSTGGQAMAALAGQKLMASVRPARSDSLDTDDMDEIQEIPSLQAVSMLNESSSSDAGKGQKGSSSAAAPPAPSSAGPSASPVPGRGAADGPFPSSISDASSEPMGDASVLIRGPAPQAISPPAAERDEITAVTGIGAAFGSPPMQASSQPFFEDVKPVGDLSLASMGSDLDPGQGGWAGGSLNSQASGRTQKAVSPPPSLRTVGPAAGLQLGSSMISAASNADGTPLNGSTIKPFSPMSVSSADSFKMGKGPGAQAATSKEPVRAMSIDEDLLEESM